MGLDMEMWQEEQIELQRQFTRGGHTNPAEDEEEAKCEVQVEPPQYSDLAYNK